MDVNREKGFMLEDRITKGRQENGCTKGEQGCPKTNIVIVVFKIIITFLLIGAQTDYDI